MTTQRTSPSGYRIALPDGWVCLNVREDMSAIVAQVVAEIDFESLPRDERPRRRAAIEGRLRTAVTGAKRMDAYALYFPLKGMNGMAIPASFVVAEATDFSGGGPVEDVLVALLAAPGASRVDVDGVAGVRSDGATEGVDDASGVRVTARQIVYTLPVPDGLQWLVIVYDVLVDDDPTEEVTHLVDALVLLFDGIMSTFRWAFADR